MICECEQTANSAKQHAAERNVAKQNGGERGIRTPEALASLPAFQASAISHYAISPRGNVEELIMKQGCVKAKYRLLRFEVSCLGFKISV